MKRIYFIAVVFALSACTSQKYSNSRYQQLNNTDDAYFSPNDIKIKPKPVPNAKVDSESEVEKYQPQSTPYYTNTDDETANPNAANRYQQQNQGNANANSPQVGNTQSYTNSNALQIQQPATINMYYQPNWGWGAPFSPFYPSPMGNSISFSSWNNSWYMGAGFNAGWGYNSWGGWNANPWQNAGYNCWGAPNPWGYHNNYYGYNNWNVYNANPWMYNPWANQWVYDPWGYNYWGYNQFNNPYYNNNNYGGGGTTTTVRNAPRRGSNSFMPALRTTQPGGNTQGGTQIIGATERQIPQDNPNTRNTPTSTNPGPTVIQPNTGNGGSVTPSAPAYNPNVGRNPNTNPNSGTVTPSAPAYNPGTPSPSYNPNPNVGTNVPNPPVYNPNAGNNNTGNGTVNPNTGTNRNVPNNTPAYQPRNPQPAAPANPPVQRNGGGNNGGGNNGGGGGRRR